MIAVHRPNFILGIVPLFVLSFSAWVHAQRNVVTTPSPGGTVVIQQSGGLPPGAVVVPEGAPGQPPGGPAPGGQPPAIGPDGKPIPPGGPNPPGGKGPDGKGPGGPSEPIKRTSTPPEPPNKKEFEVRPDEKGMVQFQFRNQAWPDLLRWLAETSNLSLDWQELPSDYLNIATQRKQSLEETRDQFNRHLLARGFTMLELDGMIQVVKTAGINVSLVPKVPPEALESLPPNRFVRTSFALTTLIAKEAALEFKPLVSANGTLNPLDSTNRLEAMDSAGNLFEIYRILQEEQSDEAQESLAREFELEFVRAADAREQIISFLGLENKTNRAASGRLSPQELMMQQQEMQMRMQMQQQQQQQQGGKPPASAASNEIYVVANARRNSVIAHAPPDKMAVIAAFLRRIDVPNENSASLQSIETRMKIYRLMSLDPKQFVTSIMAMDALEPTTKLEVDEKNRAIIAYASLSDQLIIQQTLDRLDGSARDFEVIQLRRLRAEDVAGTIKFLMGKEEPKQDDRNRRMFFDPFGYSRQQEPTNEDTFRVGANSQDNQLLLWANEVEIQEVNKLLVKLGEIPPQGLQRSRVRTIDASRSAETKEYLKRLQEAWSKVSPNPLVLPDETEFEKKDALNTPPETSAEATSATSQSKANSQDKSNIENKVEGAGKTEDAGKAEETAKPNAEEKPAKKSDADVTLKQRTANDAIPGGRLSIHQESEGETPKGSATSSKEPNSSEVTTASGTPSNASGTPAEASGTPAEAIRMQFDERGNLVLTGNDLDALDRLEQMMLTNAPPLKRYEVFYIQNARPSWVELNLKDYFKDDEPEKDSNPFAFIFGFDSGPKSKTEDPQLGKKRQLRFISDIDTRSIIVIGADEQQLKTIRSLIKLWDVPEKTNRQKLRFTKLVRIEHSRADSIVEAIKDAYRDLLSTNDKAFSKEAAGGNKESKHEASTETVSDSGGLNFSFTGRLSMGIDRITNSVIVSAEGEDLLKLVIEMIKELDQAAQPSGAVQMIEVGGTNSEAMERALKALIGPKDVQRAPQQPGMEGQQQPNMPNQFQPPESQGNAKGRSRRNG
ncbi:Bacterial type II/III secretion system short domain protein [Pirellula sp. SH-Sr6A]|nr:Bacterial type II/III secretion system short domain protein [Pirellula sp. SH-Sr6A]